MRKSVFINEEKYIPIRFIPFYGLRVIMATYSESFKLPGEIGLPVYHYDQKTKKLKMVNFKWSKYEKKFNDLDLCVHNKGVNLTIKAIEILSAINNTLSGFCIKKIDEIEFFSREYVPERFRIEFDKIRNDLFSNNHIYWFMEKSQSQMQILEEFSENNLCDFKALSLAVFEGFEDCLVDPDMINFKHWINTSLWTIDQSYYLLNNVRPENQEEVCFFDNGCATNKKIFFNMIHASINTKELIIQNYDYKNEKFYGKESLNYIPDRSQYQVKPKDILGWAQSKSIKFPEVFKNLLSKSDSKCLEVEANLSSSETENNTNKILTKREKNLLKTIGLLAEVLSHKVKNLRENDEVNKSQLIDHLYLNLPENCDDVGLGVSSLNERISKGLALLKIKNGNLP